MKIADKLMNDVEVSKNWTEPIIQQFKKEKNTAVLVSRVLKSGVVNVAFFNTGELPAFAPNSIKFFFTIQNHL